MAAGLARAQRGQPEGDVPISLEATGLSEGSEGAGTAHLLGRAGTHATRGCACARPGQPGWAPEEASVPTQPPGEAAGLSAGHLFSPQGTCSLPRAAQTTEQSPSRGASPGCPEFPPEGGARRLWRWDPGSPRILSSYPQPWAMSSGATCFLARLDIVGFGLSGSAFCQNSLSTSVEEPVGRWTARMLCSDQALGQDAQASLRPFRERDSMGHRGAAAGRVPSVDGPALLLPGAVREEALGQGLPGGGML